ncbi:hypothetical protein NL676_033238 [Syzygium grande]|nr:hypothetical protein NL676_033238 [Syzygium grande]
MQKVPKFCDPTPFLSHAIPPLSSLCACTAPPRRHHRTTPSCHLTTPAPPSRAVYLHLAHQFAAKFQSMRLRERGMRRFKPAMFILLPSSFSSLRSHSLSFSRDIAASRPSNFASDASLVQPTPCAVPLSCVVSSTPPLNLLGSSWIAGRPANNRDSHNSAK